VRTHDPNLERVELVAAALGALREQLVFVGGCAAGLLMNEPGATPIRATLDVDLVVRVTALTQYHKLEERFTRLGFKRDMSTDAPICRWKYRGIEVDLMPADREVLGFSNKWYPLAIDTAQQVTLPSGIVIRLISGPAFIATKFEAFSDRGKGDLLASHDLEDIVNVIASRTHMLDEIAQSPADLRAYLADRCRDLLAIPDFGNYLPGLIQDDSYGEQTDEVLERLRTITQFLA
jgi:predicted nucleotidyltransferase